MSILEDKLAKATKTLCLAEPFYGIFMMLMNKKWDSSIPTMCVGKESINYYLKINPEFFESLEDPHKVGLIQHEMLHIAFFHMEIADRYKDQKLLNLAMDMEVNQYIDEKYLPAYNMSLQQYKELYDPIMEDLTEKLKDGTITAKEYGQEMRKIPARGIYLKDFSELNLEPKAGTDYYYNKLADACDKKPGDPRYCKNLDELMNGDSGLFDNLDHKWEDFESLPESEKYLLRKQVDTLLKEVADHINKSRGTIPGEMADYINGLYISELPRFNWKSYLRRFIGGSKKVFTKKTRRKYNKRFDDNPGLKIKQQRRIMVAVDTSGSVTNEEMIEFFQEIYHMTKLGTDVVVVQCDTQINDVSEFKQFYPDFKEGRLKIKGRGGTSFTPAVDYYNEHKSEFSSMIYLTDGEAPIPENKPIGPMLWVISSKSDESSADHLSPKIKLN
jgi:predicted metal-dependent peptidase